MRPPLLALFAVALLAPVPALAADCSSGQICGTTTITATGPSVAPMHLASDATLTIATGLGAPASVGPGSAIEIEGGDGPLVGFAIYADQADRKGRGFVFVRIAEASAAQHDPYHWSGFGSALSVRPSSFTLPAGDYRIALLTAPGSTVAVTLRLAGLDGASLTAAMSPARFETTELHARVVEIEATPIHSQGASRVLPAVGIVIASFPMESPAHTITAQSYCSREDLGLGLDVPDAPDEVAYLPGCPTVIGDRSAGFVASSPGPIYQRLDVTAGPAGAGRYGLGYWYAGPSAIDARIPGAAGWLALD